MRKIEFTEQVHIGEAVVTDIHVAPLSFVTFVTLWAQVMTEVRGKSNASATALLQRKRIKNQVHFKVADTRVVAADNDISRLPIPVAKAIIAELDAGEGIAGEMLNEGDGIRTPAHYRLGNPIEVESNGKKTKISELEFQAQVYGDIEDVLSADGELPQALELIRKVASPVDLETLKSLPSWAVDRISIADGVTIMRVVLPRFLE